MLRRHPHIGSCRPPRHRRFDREEQRPANVTLLQHRRQPAFRYLHHRDIGVERCSKAHPRAPPRPARADHPRQRAQCHVTTFQCRRLCPDIHCNRPSCKRTTRSIFSASRSLCVAIAAEPLQHQPQELGQHRFGRMLVEVTGRSSASTSGGWFASARATATRCCSPPDVIGLMGQAMAKPSAVSKPLARVSWRQATPLYQVRQSSTF
ncbi:unnamed protein product [Acanthosepion pharaonis]|uniref:Uncharacterized protein n=1 Tax=Acanthosepion pharaonis TaxID=158019 RepID=A0A812DJ65_ACAPH|nr:unnamed protein product [Sepia pharaonis]